MMLEVGHILKKNGRTFCVLDILEFNMKKYVLFSVEDTKLEFLFYEILPSSDGYHLNLVKDDELEFKLFELVEGEKDE